MKKIVSLAVLTALVSACADLSTTSGPAGYGADGFGEETLVAAPGAEQSLSTSAKILHWHRIQGRRCSVHSCRRYDI